MFLENNEKSFLDQYYKYIRKKNNIKINDVVANGICDYKTYKLIENNEIIKNDDIYDRLNQFYGLDFHNIELLLNEMFPFIPSLYNAVENNDENKIKIMIHQIKRIITPYKKQNGIKEFFESIKIIEEFYINKRYLKEEEIKNTISYIELWENELSSILLEVCENSNLNYVVNYDLFEEMFVFLDSRDRIRKYWYAKNCIFKTNYSLALNIFNELYEEYDRLNNHIRKMKCILSIYKIYQDIDTEKAKETTMIIEQLISTTDIPNDLLRSVHYTLATYYYFNQEYRKSCFHFQESNNILNSMKSILFICSCKSRLNEFDFDFEIDKNHMLYPYLHYYELKAQGNQATALEEYIHYELLKELRKEKYEEPLWSMFRFEMSQLVKVTKRYKYYYDFEEKFQNSIKKAD